MFRKIKKGFTLVELVIVIAVIAVLAGILIPTFVSVSNKAQAAADKTFIKNANIQLAVDEAENGNIKTMYDAVISVRKIGYDVPHFKPSQDADVVWDSVSRRFALIDRNGNVIESEGEVSEKAVNLWKAYTTVPELNNQTYSIYVVPEFSGTDVAVKVGFDAGESTTITSIAYSSGTEAQTAVIRTNNVAQALTVDAPNDTVQHYGPLGEVTIARTADGSYHENKYYKENELCKTGFIQVASGRVIVENGGYVDTVVLTEKGTGATLPAVLEIKAGGTVINKYATTSEVAAANNAKTNAFQFDLSDDDPSTGALISEQDIDDAKHDAIDDVTPRTEVHVLSEADLAARAEGKVFRDGNGNYYDKLTSKWPLETDTDGSQYIMAAIFSPQSIYLIDNLDSEVPGDIAMINGTLNIDLNGFSMSLQKGISGFGSTLNITNSGSEAAITSSMDETSVAELGYNGLFLSQTINISNNVIINGIKDSPIFGNAESQTINLTNVKLRTARGGSIFAGACTTTANLTETDITLNQGSFLCSDSSVVLHYNSGKFDVSASNIAMTKRLGLSGYISKDVEIIGNYFELGKAEQVNYLNAFYPYTNQTKELVQNPNGDNYIVSFSYDAYYHTYELVDDGDQYTISTESLNIELSVPEAQVESGGFVYDVTLTVKDSSENVYLTSSVVFTITHNSVSLNDGDGIRVTIGSTVIEFQYSAS